MKYKEYKKTRFQKSADPIVYSKRQLISKELFAILEFFQKTNETIRS